jgi:hypothetical protein
MKSIKNVCVHITIFPHHVKSFKLSLKRVSNTIELLKKLWIREHTEHTSKTAAVREVSMMIEHINKCHRNFMIDLLYLLPIEMFKRLLSPMNFSALPTFGKMAQILGRIWRRNSRVRKKRFQSASEIVLFLA